MKLQSKSHKKLTGEVLPKKAVTELSEGQMGHFLSTFILK